MSKSILSRVPSGRFQHLDNPSVVVLVVCSAVLYLALVRLLRFRALHNLERKYARYVGKPYDMDYKTAHEIMKLPMLYEMPFSYGFGTQWALLKTFAVSSGTPLLVQTRQLTTQAKIGKRAADTGAILSEFLLGSVDSDRGLKALSKLNWIHGRYGKKITNDEMIHTLAMFVLEPQRWIEKYEWRPMTPLEKDASYIYWKEIGNRMGIQHIPETLKDCEEWTEEFEKTNMYYCESNRICAESAIRMILTNVPTFLHGLARHAIASLFEERVRVALGLPPPPQWVARSVSFFLSTRGFVIRHCYLPRLNLSDKRAVESAGGRFHSKVIGPEPWYIEDTARNRWMTWLATRGRLVPGPKFKSNGYLPEELGPVEYERISRDAVLKQAEAMKQYADDGGAAGAGCPFTFSR